jgi:hypothetical protein
MFKVVRSIQAQQKVSKIQKNVHENKETSVWTGSTTREVIDSFCACTYTKQ